MRRSLSLPLSLSLAIAIGCSADRDGAREAERPPAAESAPQRIISLIPSVTETIVALGAADRLVARTEFDEDPTLVHLPSVGEGLTPSLEQLAALRPDLVVVWPDNPSRSVVARLTDLGATVYAPEIQTLADMRRTASELGAILGLIDEADSLITAIDGVLERVRRAVSGRPRPVAFYVVWYDPPTTAGAGTYIHDLIEIAGGRNAFADAPGLWPQVSLEEIVRRDPDFVLLPGSDLSRVTAERLRSSVGWRDLTAVRDGAVVELDADLFNRPGPHVAEAARQLALIFHPDAFPDEVSQ